MTGQTHIAAAGLLFRRRLHGSVPGPLPVERCTHRMWQMAHSLLELGIGSCPNRSNHRENREQYRDGRTVPGRGETLTMGLYSKSTRQTWLALSSTT